VSSNPNTVKKEKVLLCWGWNRRQRLETRTARQKTG
jgi:hypothetical protein